MSRIQPLKMSKFYKEMYGLLDADPIIYRLVPSPSRYEIRQCSLSHSILSYTGCIPNYLLIEGNQTIVVYQNRKTPKR